MGYVQMNLFDFIQGLPPVVEAPPIAPPAVSIPTATKPYSISHNPKTGYRVVAAPGLTTTTGKNPCLSCPDFGLDMDGCSEKCEGRLRYLEAIGFGVGAVSDEGSYGFGN